MVTYTHTSVLLSVSVTRPTQMIRKNAEVDITITGFRVFHHITSLMQRFCFIQDQVLNMVLKRSILVIALV